MKEKLIKGQLTQEKSSAKVIATFSDKTTEEEYKEMSKRLSGTEGIPEPLKYIFGSPVNKLSYEENFLLQLYVKDVYNILDIKKGLIDKIAKKYPQERDFTFASLDFINDRYFHLVSDCAKDPNRIHSGYKLSNNAYHNLLSFLHNDELVKKGFYESIYQRYYTCFMQHAYLLFDNKQRLMTMDYDLIIQDSKNYFVGPNNIDYAVKYHLKDVINEITSNSDIKHRYCNYSFNEYKTI